MKGLGAFVLLAAAGIGAYALFFFDTTVSTGYGRVHNLGLLQDRQNLLIAAGAAACIGALMLIFGPSDSESPQARFSRAIDVGDLQLLSRMIDSGEIDPNGRAPGAMGSWIRYAVLAEAAQVCELLLRKGANPDLPDGFEWTVSEYVKESGSDTTASKQIRALFEQRPPLDPPRTASGHSPEEDSPRSIVSQLAELTRLKEAGALTDEEFEKAKRHVLG